MTFWLRYTLFTLLVHVRFFIFYDFTFEPFTAFIQNSTISIHKLLLFAIIFPFFVNQF